MARTGLTRIADLATELPLGRGARPHTPKLAVVARPSDYVAFDGKTVRADSIDLLARIFSMESFITR